MYWNDHVSIPSKVIIDRTVGIESRDKRQIAPSAAKAIRNLAISLYPKIPDRVEGPTSHRRIREVHSITVRQPIVSKRVVERSVVVQFGEQCVTIWRACGHGPGGLPRAGDKYFAALVHLYSSCLKFAIVRCYLYVSA